MTSLQPHQQRVVKEREELGGRLGKLLQFIGSPAFGAVDNAERLLLLKQAALMQELCFVLSERIAGFKAPPRALVDAVMGNPPFTPGV